MRNRRTFGYVVDIQEGKSDNTSTPFNFTVVTRLLFPSDDGSSGVVWARVQAFSSNFVTLEGEAILEGTIVEGILTATYGTHLTATFGSLIKSSVSEWRLNGAGPPFCAEDTDLDPWSWSPLPTLGGSGFATRKENLRITGVRIAPPDVEVFQYHLRKEEGKRSQKECEPSSSSGRIPSKSKLAESVYTGVRRAHSEAVKTEARNLRRAERERNEKQERYTRENEERYLRVFRERGRMASPTHENDQKPPEAEETPAEPENEEAYPRLVEALAALPTDHANHIRSLIMLPSNRWKDFVPPRETWQLCVIPPSDASDKNTKDEKNEKK